MIRAVSISLGLLVVIGSFVLANKFQKPQKSSPPPPPPKVVMIGDSLSVGGFGELVREHLEHEFGRQNVAFFASCGSSPENWLQNEPVFHTRCGYRENHIRAVLARFVSAAHRGGTRKMIWIGPPDSSRFSKVQNRIYRLIQQSVWRGDPMIDSRRFTRYLVGKTGGDGIHYNRESGEAWARRVIASIDQVLAADIAARRKLASNR